MRLVKYFLLYNCINRSAAREDSLLFEKRQLATTINSNIRSSAECKNECIDKNSNYDFCPTHPENTIGTCCNGKECDGKVSICASQANSLKEMMYQACPHEKWCGKWYVTPDKTGAIKSISP